MDQSILQHTMEQLKDVAERIYNVRKSLAEAATPDVLIAMETEQASRILADVFNGDELFRAMESVLNVRALIKMASEDSSPAA
ncbi:hypothetical protein [Sulfobacillus harzensis]|uniref:Uncharacterized protein n=1 Tax=Sulfobacillus harzensis TaxID=2729629 RepID=A0A7Y0Q3X6_9FIRM|nr:hypothetical protein [Sulfobacillus harzensis]NMP22639.1 hypothetical protein [Sulfobacillus harzensis]